MKKLIIAVFAMFIILFTTQNVKADDLPSFYDFVNEYGVAGQRNIGWPASTNYGNFYAAVKSDEKLLIVKNDALNEVYVVSTSNFYYSQENAERYNWIQPSYLGNGIPVHLRSAISSQYDMSGRFYGMTFGYNSVQGCEFDIEFDGTTGSWNNWLETYPMSPSDPNSPNNPNNPNYNKLPMLSYNISAKTIYKFPATFDTKEILTWDYTTKSPYKDNPTNYSMEIIVSGNLNNDKTIDFANKLLNTSHQVTLSNGGTGVAENTFSWLAFDTGKKFYGTYGWEFPPFTDNVDNSLAGYLVFVRCKDNTDPTKVSAWKIFSVDGHGIMSNTGYVQSDNEIKPKPENDADTGTPTVAPQYSTDNTTSAESDPTGQNYNGAADYNPSTLLANLKAIVNSLQELPTLLGQIFTFFPDWFINLIIVSIGMLVVIGVVKSIVN